MFILNWTPVFMSTWDIQCDCLSNNTRLYYVKLDKAVVHTIPTLILTNIKSPKAFWQDVLLLFNCQLFMKTVLANRHLLIVYAVCSCCYICTLFKLIFSFYTSKIVKKMQSNATQIIQFYYKWYWNMGRNSKKLIAIWVLYVNC